VKPIEWEKLLEVLRKHTHHPDAATAPAAAPTSAAAGVGTTLPSPRSAHLEALLAKPGSAKLVVTFVSKLGERCDAIRAAIDAKDFETLKRLAHQLKGAAGGYGFPAITDAAAALERATADDAAKLPELIRKLTEMCDQARAAVPLQPAPTTNAA